MPAFSGKFQRYDIGGGWVAPASCQLQFDEEACSIAPASGAPIAFDLGDVECVEPGDWNLELTLNGGARILLRQFGPVFGEMCAALLDAWRARTVRCLLLEDMEEVVRYQAATSRDEGPLVPAEIRIYKSNLAVLPLGAVPYQWRLAEVDSISFDETTYTVRLESGAGRVTIGKLAKKTEEFRERLAGTLGVFRTSSARALHDTFPFLCHRDLGRLADLMREGRSVRLAALRGIHPDLPAALAARAVSPRLKPYFEALSARSLPDSLMAGFKFVRPDEDPETPEAEEDAAPEEAAGAGEDRAETPLFFWFFFPLARDGVYSNLVAWEATTGSGRASYFFRAPAPFEESISVLTRGLAQVNFRREPVYLSDESLARQPRFHRYAIGARKLPELRTLRAAMAGRAIHSTLEEWGARVESVAGA